MHMHVHAWLSYLYQSLTPCFPYFQMKEYVTRIQRRNGKYRFEVPTQDYFQLHPKKWMKFS